MKKKITVEVWSDFVCPWCWIAKKRLEQAIDAFGDQVEVEVVPRAYRLAKGMNPIAFKQALLQKMGSHDRADMSMQAIRESALLEGLEYRFDLMQFGDTSTAHKYVKAISDPALQALYIERLYRAGTTEGKDIFSHDALRDLATEVGATELNGFESAEAEIRNDEALVNGLGTGIPLFLINGSRYISGAQKPAAFIQALHTAIAELPSDEEAIGAASCSISGCSH